MKKLTFLITALAASASVFGQSDEELLAQVRKHYYDLQNNLHLERITVNDTVFCSVKGNSLLKTNEVIHYGKRTQGSYNYSNPFYYVCFSSRFSAKAALISPRCVKACGKLPSCSPRSPISSANRPK